MSQFLFSVLISIAFAGLSMNLQAVSSQALTAHPFVFNNDSTVLAWRWSCEGSPKSDIAREGYDLSINRYKEVVHEEVDHRPPQAILDELESIEKEITQGMKQLRGMLK